MSQKQSKYVSLSEFLLGAPLYQTFAFSEGHVGLYELYGAKDDTSSDREGEIKFDGYCCYCEKDTTFKFQAQWVPNGAPWNDLPNRYAFDEFLLECQRKSHAKYRYIVRKLKNTVQKIGQHPSLADIAVAELTSKYKQVLKSENRHELFKAIGLAAHGEGIASFVYLRRVFERIIWEKFKTHQAEQNWKEDEFIGLHLDKKIEFLKGYLPEFMITNSKLYGILSTGIHELENERCLAFFDTGKRTIALILEEDLRRKEQLSEREQLKKAVADFRAAVNQKGEEKQ